MTESRSDEKANVVLVFTHGISLRRWFEVGFYSREVDYYKELAESVGSVVFLTYDTTDPQKDAELADLSPIRVVHNYRRLNHRIFGLLSPILRYRSMRHADLIKTNQLFGSWTGLLLKWVLRKPLLARCGYAWSLNVKRSGASSWRNRITRLVERFVLKRADAIAVADRFAQNYLAELHGIDNSKFTILPNYVDTEKFFPAPDVERVRNDFIYVGRLSKEKRPQLAVEAAKQVPEIRLRVFGQGNQFDSLQRIIGIDRNVDLVGAIPYEEIARQMRVSTALVITSQYEGSPKVVIEAMSSGLPVIAVKAPGLNEIVEHGVNGLLVDPDAEAIADAMRLLNTNKELWRKLSENGRRFAEKTYSKSSVLEREVSLIERLTNKSFSDPRLEHDVD